MHLQPEAQRAAKREILLESLRRSGGVSFGGEVVVRSGPEFGYRVRARFHVKSTRRGTLVGFFEPGSHRVVDVGECLQISDEANRVLRAVRGFLASSARRSWELESFELLEPVATPEAASGGEGGRVVAHFIVKKGKGPARVELEELVQRENLGGIVVSRSELETRGPTERRVGEVRTRHWVAGYQLGASVRAFFQANRFLLGTLVDEVVPPSQEQVGRAVDLYCGVGLFSLPLARFAESVVGVEVSAAAVADARLNAKGAGLDNIDFIAESAATYATREGFDSVDLVVADPPRPGLERAVVDALCRRPPREIRYVSCDPASLGRDAGRLREGGLELARLVLLDFFPNTHHVESVATFRRR
jgi:23S rRNA (uracil1939-C5)-methyltransferase